MPKNWKTYKLEDALEVLIDYRGKTPKKTLSGIPLVTAKIVKRGAIQEPKEFIAIKDYDKWMVRGFPEIGDIVLTTEAPLGEVAIIKNNKIALAQRIVTLRGTVNILDSTYLKYFLQSSIGQNRLVARESGTTVTGIKQSELRKVLIECPPYKEQTQIANILSAIDDKIENNLAINKTLEDMAMALYKHWFVDFGPFQEGEFIDSELGLIPKGWEVKSVYSTAQFINGAAFKPKDFIDNTEVGLPVIKIVEIKQGITSQTKYSNKKLDEKYIINNNDILFPWSGNPHTSLGIHLWDKGKALLNQHIFVVRVDILNSKCFVFNTLKNLLPTFINLATHKQTTGLGHVTISNLKELNITTPDNNIIKEYESIANPILELIYNNQIESNKLTKLRDTLLPKLISGEVRLKEFKKEEDAEMNSA
jgi:type I restriction enzyme S subunit